MNYLKIINALMLRLFQNKLLLSSIVTILSCIVSVLFVFIIYKDDLLQFILIFSIFVRFLVLTLILCFFQKMLNDRIFHILFIFLDAIVYTFILLSLIVLIGGGVPSKIGSVFLELYPALVLIITNLLFFVVLYVRNSMR